MAKKHSFLKTCLVLSLFPVVIIGGVILLHHFYSPAELSKEEVRILLREVRLPETLNPSALDIWCSVGEGDMTLGMRIRVKGDQTDELLDTWLQGANRMSRDEALKRKDARGAWMIGKWGDMMMCDWGTELRDDDIMAFKNFKAVWDVHFVLRKRDAGVDIYCSLHGVPQSYVSKDMLLVMYKDPSFGIRGRLYKRRLGEFDSD